MNYSALTVTANKGILRCIQTKVQVCIPENVSDTQVKNCITVDAVWDTGAMVSSLSKKIIAQLGIQPIGFTKTHTANGIVDNTGQYLLAVLLPNNLLIPQMIINDFEGGPGVDMLIGMDIICAGDFSITNANKNTVMSFRIPPDAFHIDYVRTQKKDKSGKMLKEQLKKKQI